MSIARLVRLVPLAGLAATLSCTTAVEVPGSVNLSMAIATGGTPGTQEVNTIVGTVPTVRVTNASGAPVPDVQVLFVPTTGLGTVGAGEVLTNNDGIATPTFWRYGVRAGAQDLAVAIVSATADARVTFTGTANPGPPATVSVAPTAITLRIDLTRQISAFTADAYGNPTTGGPTPTFASVDAAIATVTNTGLVTGVGRGATTVRVTVGAVLRDVPVVVGDRPAGTDITVTTVGDEPYGVATRSDGLVYVVRGTSTSLSRFQLPGTASLGSIATGSGRTTDVAFVPGQNLAYTANIDSSTVSVISTSTHALLRTVGAGGEVLRVRASPAGDYVFAITTGGDLKRISTADDAISTLSLGGTLNGLAVNAARGVLYVTSYEGALFEVSLATFTLKRQVAVGSVAQAIAVVPGGNILFVAVEGVGTRMMDAATLAAGAAFGPTGAFDVAVTNDGVEVYVSAPSQGIVSVHNATTRAQIRTHSIAAPRRIAFSVDGLTAIVASQGGAVYFIR